MGGIGSITNPWVLILFIVLFFDWYNRYIVAGIGMLTMLGLWIQGDSWILGLVGKVFGGGQ